jgi:hypothetical protein
MSGAKRFEARGIKKAVKDAKFEVLTLKDTSLDLLTTYGKAHQVAEVLKFSCN